MLRAPRSTLFPYTTLFRSAHDYGLLQQRLNHDAWIGRVSRLRGQGHVRRQAPPATDRKSTRLNSSHRTISYAVFCLKKKKKKPIHSISPTQTNTINTPIPL